jgi:hypothetical protein
VSVPRGTNFNTFSLLAGNPTRFSDGGGGQSETAGRAKPEERQAGKHVPPKTKSYVHKPKLERACAKSQSEVEGRMTTGVVR